MPPAAERDGAGHARLRTRDAVALGLLQGPAELLPISSSGHVALVPWLLGWPYSELDDGLRKSFEVALHAGTVAALLVGLRREVGDAARALDARGLRLLTLSTLPPAIAGLTLGDAIERRAGQPRAIAAGLVAGALAMAAAGGQGTRRRGEARAVDAVALGVAQACALAPGVSRSGATLAAARLRGFAPADASVLSRHVALPVIAGATGLKAVRELRRGGLPAGAGRGFAAGIAAAFAATLATLPLVRAADRGRSLLPFAAYRIALAALVLRRLRRA
jgi:undecaprenyl-diphosphatase